MNTEPPASKSPIFSEFSGVVGRFFRMRYWYAWVAAAFFLGTWVVLWLGDLAGANCFIITVTPLIEGVPLDPVQLVHGYLSQANHGFFYLFVAPAAICLMGVFLAQVEVSLHQLRETDTLTEKGYSRIVAANRKLLRGALWILLPGLIIWNLQRELPSIPAAEKEKTFHMGYTQVFSVAKWAERLNISPNPWPVIVKFDNRNLMEKAIREAFMNSSLPLKQRWWHKKIAKVPGRNPTSLNLLAEPNIPDADVFNRGNYSLDIPNAINIGEIKLKISASKNRPNQSITRQYVFAVAVQLLEGTFHGLAIWLALKSIFVLFYIWKLLPDSKDNTPDIKLFCTDPMFHFGLTALHPVYNKLVIILLLSGASFSLVYFSGGSWLPNDQTSFISTVGTLVFIATAVTAVLFAIVIGPMFAFHQKLRWKQISEIRHINQLLAQPSLSSEEKSNLLKQRAIVEQQATWPNKDKIFKKALLTTFILITLPVILPITKIVDLEIPGIDSAKSIPTILDVSVRNISAWIYRRSFEVLP